MLRSILLTVAVCGLVLADVPESAKPQAEFARFTAELRKKDDTFSVEAKGDSPAFRIRSQSGIGSGKITRREGKWPATVTVRFEKMQMLESFVAKIGKAEISGTLKSANQPLYFDKDGMKQDKAEGSAFGLQIVQMEAERGLEARITLPEEARGLDAIELHWIDAYR
jgi:hypothetical protein